MRRNQPHRRHRQGVLASLARVVGNRRSGGPGPGARARRGDQAALHARASAARQQPVVGGRSHAVPGPGRHRALGRTGQARSTRRPVRPRRTLPAVPGRSPRPMGRAIFHAVQPQSMEAGTLCALVPPRRREPGPEDVVPLPDPLRRFPTRARRDPWHPPTSIPVLPSPWTASSSGSTMRTSRSC